jgi:O-antigen ligase
MNQVASEVTAYSRGGAATEESSSGMRLKYWRHSLEAVAEKPLLGHGAGSWNNEYMRLKGAWQPGVLYAVSDPHQIFLLWAVEGGLLGLCLLCAVLLALWRLAQSFGAPERLTMQTLMLGMVVAGLFNSVPFGIGLGDFFCVGLGILAAFRQDLPASVAANREGQLG